MHLSEIKLSTGLQEGDVGRGQRNGLGDRDDVLQHCRQLAEHGNWFVFSTVRCSTLYVQYTLYTSHHPDIHPHLSIPIMLHPPLFFKCFSKLHCCIPGGGFIMTIYLSNGTKLALIARETAPAAAYKDMYHGNANLTHYGR